MVEALRALVSTINRIHDALFLIIRRSGLPLSDKQLHFWILGMIGIVLFIGVDCAFRLISKWSISALSFIYVFTILVVVALSLEIQQLVTGSGAVDFVDVVAGLWGFLTLFCVYLLMRIAVRAFSRARQRFMDRRRPADPPPMG